MAGNKETIETPKMAIKVTKPRKIETNPNVALILSSDDSENENESPVIAKRPIEIDNEIEFRPKRVKIKLKKDKFSPKKKRSNLDVSRMVKESSLFQAGNRQGVRFF